MDLVSPFCDAFRPYVEGMATLVFSREIRNDDGEDLAIVTAEEREGGEARVMFEMPELGATLTPAEAERVGLALLAAAQLLRKLRGTAGNSTMARP